MSYLLDTDTLIFWLNGDQTIAQKADEVGRADLHFSTVSLAELYFGAYNSKEIDRNLKVIQQLSLIIDLIPFERRAAQLFGQIKAALKQQGNLLLDADLMIASVALVNELTIVTNNTKHFTRIPNLSLENWITS